MKLFLTGATGFIGSQLARRLVAEGHDLAIVVRPDSKLDILRAVLPQIHVHVHVYDGSYASLLYALETAQPELVCHVASLFLAQHKSEDVARLVESNLNFPAQLLEAMNQLGIKRLINTGTSWQHYKNEAYNPVNLYAATKQAFESLLAYYVEAQDFKAITLKLFDTYGPGDTRPKLFSLLRKTARTGEPLRMSPGEQLIDMVYIDDVLDAYLLAAERLLQNQVSSWEEYAVTSGNPIRLRDLVDIYSRIIDKPLPIEWGACQYRDREVMNPWIQAPILPNWDLKIPLHIGIERMEHANNI